MAGFTIEYDGEGNAIGTTTREQELHDIFSRDGSFGFGDSEYEQAKMSAMRNELLKLSFTVSQYSGPLSYGAFPQASSIPDPGSAGALQSALTARVAKQMRGEPVEKVSGYMPGLLSTDMTQNMSPEDQQLVREHVPAMRRTQVGVLPEMAVGAYGGSWAWPNLLSMATQRTLQPEVSGKHRAIGAALGGVVLPAAAMGYHALRDTSADDEQLIREARVRKALSEQEQKTADVSPASSWDGGINGGGKLVSSLPNPDQAGGMQAELTRRVVASLEKRGYSAQTPGGRLAHTRSIGTPKVTEPDGPSISDVAKPKGPKFGGPIPGAKKGLI